MNPVLVKIIFQPSINRAAHTGLAGRNRDRLDATKGRFTHDEVDQILKKVWLDYDQLAPQVPREPKLGNRMNMYLACITLSSLKVLIATGIERAYAIELIGDLAWNVYERWGRLAHFFARSFANEPRKQLRMAVNLFLRFPFTPPGYQFERLPNQNGISFDMLRCPIAEYFQSHEASDLCINTWCNLDFPLAKMWGGWLDRTETLAAGGPRCDFRFNTSE